MGRKPWRQPVSLAVEPAPRGPATAASFWASFADGRHRPDRCPACLFPLSDGARAWRDHEKPWIHRHECPRCGQPHACQRIWCPQLLHMTCPDCVDRALKERTPETITGRPLPEDDPEVCGRRRKPKNQA